MRRSTGVVLKQRVALAVIAVLAVNPSVTMAGGGPPEAAPRPAAAARVGSLVVESEPAGAAVYVDGQLAGQTPLQVASLTAGDHRVRLVKGGYLENARLVSVNVAAASTVRVRLTRDAGSRPELAAQSGGGGAVGGGASKLPLILALAGGGAGGAYFLSKKDNSSSVNQAPRVGSFTASPATGIVATNTTFTAVGAADPEGDALSFSWNFGDGTPAGTGATPTHVYTSAGTFNVTVTVMATGGSVSTTTSLVVKSLTGQWTGPLVGASTTYNTVVDLTQSGTALTGTHSDNEGNSGTVSAGSVNVSTRQVVFTVTVGTFIPFTFTGTPNATATTMNGVANGSEFSNSSWTLTRP